jgi:hypothetical protein
LFAALAKTTIDTLLNQSAMKAQQRGWLEENGDTPEPVRLIQSEQSPASADPGCGDWATVNVNGSGSNRIVLPLVLFLLLLTAFAHLRIFCRV